LKPRPAHSEVSMLAFRHLATMKSLKHLSFFHPAFGKKEFIGSGFALLKDRLTFPVIEQLAVLPNLKKLKLEGVDITADDVEKLRAKMPGVSIDWKPMSEEERKRLQEFLK
jgi:hypothetical protein